MANNPGMISSGLPWTKDQFNQMKTMLTVTIPMQEDTLKRTAASGLDVKDLQEQLAQHKANLTKMIAAWEDKYK